MHSFYFRVIGSYRGFKLGSDRLFPIRSDFEYFWRDGYDSRSCHLRDRWPCRALLHQSFMPLLYVQKMWLEVLL